MKLAMRVTPAKERRGPTGKGKGKKKKGGTKHETGVAAARASLPFSTNISSPPTKDSKHRRSRVVRVESDNEEPRDFHANGYAEDDFVVDDDHISDDQDESEDGFAPPMRKLDFKRKAARGALTAPITTDATLESLSANHRFIIDDFLFHAKQECERIREANGLRNVPFTDTILRQMAIKFPRNLKELGEIPNIRPEMVERHGKRLLPLVKNAKERLESLGAETDDGEEQPMDPNHHVINLVSDDEESEYGSMPSEDDDEQVSSSYFKNKAPDVQEWNQRWSLTQQHDQGGTSQAITTSKYNGAGSSKSNYNDQRRGSANWGGRDRGRAGSKKPYKKRSNGSNGKASRNANDRRGGRGGSVANTFGNSGIGMMPT